MSTLSAPDFGRAAGPGAAGEWVDEVGSDGSRIRVAVRPGRGVPLLLCNGIGASLALLQPFVDTLDPAIPVIRFDAPGIGGSDLPQRPYGFPTLGRRLTRILDEMGVDDFDVLGISWGGAVAQQLALQNPRRCRRVVLVSTATGFLMIPAHPRVLSKMVTPRRHRDPEYAATVAAELYGGRLREEPELAGTVLGGHAPTASGRGYLFQLLAGIGWTSLPFLPLLRQPTLVLAGDDDPIIPVANAHMMTRLLPRGTLHVYPDGHLGLVTHADDLAPRIAAFLDDGRPRDDERGLDGLDQRR